MLTGGLGVVIPEECKKGNFHMVAPTPFLVTSFYQSETSNLLEWIAQHQLCGVSEFHIFIPKSNSGGQKLTKALSEAGVLSFSEYENDSGESDFAHCAALAARVGVAQGGFGLFVAADEYLNVHDKPAFKRWLSRKTFTAMALPVQVFLNEGRDDHIPGPVTIRTTTRSNQLDRTLDGGIRCICKTGAMNGPVNPENNGSKQIGINAAGAELGARIDPLNMSDEDLFPIDPIAVISKYPAPSHKTAILHQLRNPKNVPARAFEMGPTPDDLDDNTTQDLSLISRAQDVEQQIQKILGLPGIRAAYEELCAQELEILSQNPAPPTEQTKPAQAPEEVDRYAQDLSEPPAPWFVDIYPGGTQQGFMRSLEHHSLIGIERDKSTLVVCFDNLSNVNDLSFKREPWAYSFIKEFGYSQLGVIARRKDWYRDPQLIAELEKLASDGYFDQFGRVIMTGTSMGGFGALAFSSLSPGCTVVSYSPQTTLDKELVPWEKRFQMGANRNWSLPYSDCAFEIEEAKRVHVFYDPYFEPDRAHVERLDGSNVNRYKTWYSNHFSPVFLRRAKLLKPIMEHALRDTLTPELFYQLYRDRKNLQWYRGGLERHANSLGHDTLAKRIAPAFRRRKRQLKLLEGNDDNL